ncbi:hypothetical protein [Pseudomonas sp. PS02290]|uniref:hypothetical protein n=1 Tax=Pseudomonas sp. PS02290 TaxID=2991430 RepID=UPI002499BB8E|nr:hypothetical protein [Pseudomonas sp. PS02290]
MTSTYWDGPAPVTSLQWQSPGEARCVYSAPYGAQWGSPDKYTELGGGVVRHGDSCSEGSLYDSTTGACKSSKKDGELCEDQTGGSSADPMIWSSKSGSCVNFTDSDDNATCGYLGNQSGPGSSYKVSGTWDGGLPSAPPTFASGATSCEVGTISTTDCVTDVKGAVTCNVIGKFTGKVNNKSNVVDAKDAACPGGSCDPILPTSTTKSDPCVYSGSGDSVSCTSHTESAKEGTQKCGTVNGSMSCFTVPPSSNGIKIDSTVKTTPDPDGGKTAVKTDTATKTTCTGINKCSTTVSTTTTTTKTNGAGQTTGTKTDCKGTCGSSGTGITPGKTSGNGTGDEASGDCTSEDCGSGGAGGLTDPENGNFDGQSSDWDKKIEDGKKDLKDRIDKMKTAFDPLSQANLGGGGGQLFCPPAVEFYGHSITFCLDQFASSLSWIAAAVYASCALTALFIIFL